LTVDEIVEARGIMEVLHFTTSVGLVGILDSRAVKPRARLPMDKRLEFIFRPNAAFRKDAEWLDHVSLSLSRINSEFFGKSRIWHRDLDIWWCILSFRPEILTHRGVVFTTTNNKYNVAVRKVAQQGLSGYLQPPSPRTRAGRLPSDPRICPPALQRVSRLRCCTPENFQPNSCSAFMSQRVLTKTRPVASSQLLVIGPYEW
jgi:hypothetical protein